ncbi:MULTISPECIES: hypothetical protein [Streptomyces]|uniref:hypothetical protein n=1 Tax=Streptomyces TaxID=1883 RepID=UPI0021A76121|nr:hypothetical protein [Streptomyces atratus]MCT2546930.1 hypothetical protein [Streptomyces atratus]
MKDPSPTPPLDAKDVLVAAERFPWALAAPGELHWPDGEFMNVALRAVRTEELDGYIERLEVFVEQYRAHLEEMLRAYGPGNRPASAGSWACFNAMRAATTSSLSVDQYGCVITSALSRRSSSWKRRTSVACSSVYPGEVSLWDR